MKPATPITAAADDYQIRAVAQKLERDREALMEALEVLLEECDYQAMCGTFNETRVELSNAKSALSAARANFPTP